MTRFFRLFIPKDRLIYLAWFGFIVTLILGYWQLSRAAEKKQINNNYALAKKAEAQYRNLEKAKPFDNIKVKGRYLPLIFLLDNQYHQHQLGYDVLSPFLIHEKDLILIDRGWIKADASRSYFPDIKTPLMEHEIQGYVYYPSPKTFVLGELSEKKSDQLILIEKIDQDLMTKLLHKKVYPFIIRLDKNQAHGFIRDWPLISMTAERHHAYAFQWFAMALCLFVFILIKQLRNRREK